MRRWMVGMHHYVALESMLAFSRENMDRDSVSLCNHKFAKRSFRDSSTHLCLPRAFIQVPSQHTMRRLSVILAWYFDVVVMRLMQVTR